MRKIQMQSIIRSQGKWVASNDAKWTMVDDFHEIFHIPKWCTTRYVDAFFPCQAIAIVAFRCVSCPRRRCFKDDEGNESISRYNFEYHFLFWLGIHQTYLWMWSESNRNRILRRISINTFPKQLYFIYLFIIVVLANFGPHLRGLFRLFLTYPLLDRNKRDKISYQLSALPRYISSMASV